MAKTRVTELPVSPIVVGTDEVVIIQNGKTYKATVSQLALAPVEVTVANILGLTDALSEKADLVLLDDKADVNHTHVSDDIIDASETGKSLLTAADANEAVGIFPIVNATSKGLIPSYGNVSANTTTTFTSAGWLPYNITGIEGVKFDSNTSSRSVSLAINTLTLGANVNNYTTVFAPVYDDATQTHLKISLDAFARKVHQHSVENITDITPHARTILDDTTLLQTLETLGPVFGGAMPIPSLANVGLSDGNFDTINISGVYDIIGDWSNGYKGVESQSYTGVLDVRAISSTTFYQEFRFLSNTRPTIFSRYISAGAVGQWRLTSSDVVGTVSNIGNSPSGAIIERGSNVNGSYIRFADGTQICTATLGFQSISGASATRQWIFPAVFTGESPYLGATLDTASAFTQGWSNDSLYTFTAESLAGSSANFRLSSNYSGITTGYASVTARYIAIGRWY